MSSVIFTSAQRIISQVFNWLQSSGQAKTNNLITDAFQSGIDNATTIGEGFIVVPGSNNTLSTPTVSITTGGIAYDPNANRIFISPSDTTLYNSANPTTTTNDGLGNFLLTPQSTGVVNIPMIQSSQNYIWVDYLSAIDTSAYTLNEVTQAKQFYKQTDGYAITVTTVNTPPDATSVYLANVNLTTPSAVGPSNISQTGRQYFNVLPNIVPITTPQANRSDATTTYNPASSYTLEAHIKAVGTNPTGVSPTNPHAMTLADLGVSTLDTVISHRQFEHGTIQSSGNAAANAIIAGTPGTPSPSTSAMAAQINIVNPGSDYLTVFFLLATEFAIVNGTAYNTTAIFGGPSNASIFFPDVSGVYNVYWDSVVKAFASSTSDISADVTKLWIATVTYTFVGHGPSDHNALSALTDRRRMGSSTHLLQRWLTSARPGSGLTAPASGEFGFNLTTGLLEYWDGSNWQQPVSSSSNSTVPTGSLLPFAGASAPSGFLMADGSSHSTASFPNLFAVIGYTYGGGGASFNVPNLINNVPIGAGSIAPFGTTAGSTTASDTVTPTENAHQHIGTATGGSGVVICPPSSGWPFGYSNVTTTYGQAGASAVTATIPWANTSSTTATINPITATVSTIQPSIGVSYIIKT